MVAGHLQEKNGTFYMVLCYPGADGKSKSKWITTKLPVKGNKKKAEELLRQTRETFVPPESPVKALTATDMFFTDFLTLWLSVAKTTLSMTTYASYVRIIKNVLIPYFDPMHLLLKDVKPKNIQSFYMEQLEKVSASSVIHYHATLHRALKYAVKIELIENNPADRVDRPKREAYQGSFYSEEELQKLFEAAKGTKLELPIVMASFYGLRRSEVLGLKWNAIDFVNNSISIQHTFNTCSLDGKKLEIASDTTKTKSSRRTLPLIPQFREMLLCRMEQQKEYKRVCGKCYNRQYEGYLCVDEMGNIIKPDHLTCGFSNLLNKNNMRHIRFHDLRHTCASLLLKNGVPMKQIQEWLGHSDYSTTANIYAHLDYNSKNNSAQAMLTGMSDALVSLC